MGLAEILALLMTLSGFGVDENPNAPTANDVLATAPARADYMAHVDLVAIVPNNYQRLMELPDHPSIANEPEAREALKMILSQVEGGRGFVKASLGIDPITDITSVTAWLNVPEQGKENVLLVVRGNIPEDAVDMIAGTAGMKTETISGRTAAVPEPGMLIAVSPRGELLVGAKAWVAPRLSKRWKRKRNSAMTRGLGPVLDAKPAVAVASAPSRRWIRQLEADAGGTEDALPLDLLTGHAFLGVALLHNGVEWSVTAREKSGYKRAVRASWGVLDTMRALHHGSRGVARLMLAALPSFAGSDEVVDAILRHEDDLMKLVLETTGDGKFEVDFSKDPKAKTVRVKAWGDELSDVLPAAGLLPMMAGSAVFFVRAGADEAAGFKAAPATVPPPTP